MLLQLNQVLQQHQQGVRYAAVDIVSVLTIHMACPSIKSAYWVRHALRVYARVICASGMRCVYVGIRLQSAYACILL